MKRVKLGLLILLLGIASQAHALLIEATPANQAVFVGDVAVFDVVATGLGADLIGAYDVTLSWDAAVLSLLGVTFDSFLDGPVDSIRGTSTGAGMVNVFEISLGGLSLQDGSDFRLFSLMFDALAEGSSPLGFDGLIVGDAFGNGLDPSSAPGSIELTARPTNSVPAPPVHALFLVGALALGLVRRGRKRPGSRFSRSACFHPD